jgi:hypothetical protein
MQSSVPQPQTISLSCAARNPHHVLGKLLHCHHLRNVLRIIHLLLHVHDGCTLMSIVCCTSRKALSGAVMIGEARHAPPSSVRCAAHRPPPASYT